MAEYIERTEELMLAMNAGARAIENTRRYHGAIYTKDVFLESPQEIPYLQAAKVLREVSDAPAADVAPVRQGRWVFGKDLPYSWGQILKNKYHLYCSECLDQAFNRSEDNDPDFDVDTSYCPKCGAKMDLEEEK